MLSFNSPFSCPEHSQIISFHLPSEPYIIYTYRYFLNQWLVQLPRALHPYSL